jgi:SAM-dependent methyltransferase
MERALSDAQLEEFDTEYVDEQKWASFKACCDRDFAGRAVSVLDVGGGNGRFADRILAAYSTANVTILDNAPSLLAKNSSLSRKQVVHHSALELESLKERYDIISMNWLLHHLVGDTYAHSIRNIRETLCKCHSLLKPRGRVSIYDNLYDGWLWAKGPSRIIYELTAVKWKPIARLAARAGANTAGVGVCFQSELAWREHFHMCGLKIESFSRYRPFARPAWLDVVYGVALHLRPAGAGHFWLAPIRSSQARQSTGSTAADEPR